MRDVSCRSCRFLPTSRYIAARASLYYFYGGFIVLLWGGGISFRYIHSGLSGINFPPTFIFSTVPLSLNLCLSLCLFSSPPSTSLGFIGEGVSPSPLLVWSGLLIYHSLSSQDILPLPVSLLSLSLFLPHSLSLSSPPSLSAWGVGGGEYLLTLFLFNTLTLFPYTQRTRSHTHAWMIMLDICT